MTIKTLDQLIEELNDIRDAHGGDVIVRIAQQPNYPLANTVGAVTFVTGEQHREKCVWFATGHIGSHMDESPYAPSAAWEGGEFDLDDDDDGDR